MSATAGSGPEPVSDSADDQRYFQAIEETFIRLRGAPLLLSPADWRTAQGWRRAGIPLGLVRSTLEEIFERRRERGATDMVSSLRYCKRAVEKAWSEARELSASAERVVAPPLELRPLLTALAERLPADLLQRGAVGEEILALETTASGDPEAVERALGELEAKLLDRLEGELDPQRRQAVEAAERSALAALERRLPQEQIEAARLRLRRKLLRRELDLPVFSLFSAPEAPD